MLYLVTGANGAGKTLNTLKWVQERATKENRPVAHNGRFEPLKDGPLANWKQIDFKDWQQEPDGTIFLIDEAHNDLPLRSVGSAPPDHVKMLAEHRRRGFDFYLITQHPSNVDAFVRRLIGSPGWHRHLKRAFGGDLVSVIEWPAVNTNCEKNNSGSTGTVTMVPFPKEVYNWYKSASLHTGKRKFPKQVYFLALAVLVLPLLLYFGYSNFMGIVDQHDEDPTTSDRVSMPNITQAGPEQVSYAAPSPSANMGAMTTEEYVAAHTPRIGGLPHTAPIYDGVTQPVHAPYPAACISMGSRCECYTQQGTKMNLARSICSQIVENGLFLHWHEEASGRTISGGSSKTRPQIERSG